MTKQDPWLDDVKEWAGLMWRKPEDRVAWRKRDSHVAPMDWMVYGGQDSRKFNTYISLKNRLGFHSSSDKSICAPMLSIKTDKKYCESLEMFNCQNWLHMIWFDWIKSLLLILSASKAYTQSSKVINISV